MHTNGHGEDATPNLESATVALTPNPSPASGRGEQSEPPRDVQFNTALPILTDERQVGRSPFTLMIGLKFVQCQGSAASFAVESAPELLNMHEAFHGGVIMSMLDAGMATAALSSIDFTQVVVTLDMSVSFLRAASGKLTSVGVVTGRAGSICHCEGKVSNETGEVVATGIGSFKFQRKTVHSDDAAPS